MQQNHTKHVEPDLLNVCSNNATFNLQGTRFFKTQFADYVSDTPVTLKQGQGH